MDFLKEVIPHRTKWLRRVNITLTSNIIAKNWKYNNNIWPFNLSADGSKSYNGVRRYLDMISLFMFAKKYPHVQFDVKIVVPPLWRDHKCKNNNRCSCCGTGTIALFQEICVYIDMFRPQEQRDKQRFWIDHSGIEPIDVNKSLDIKGWCIDTEIWSLDTPGEFTLQNLGVRNVPNVKLNLSTGYLDEKKVLLECERLVNMNWVKCEVDDGVDELLKWLKDKEENGS